MSFFIHNKKYNNYHTFQFERITKIYFFQINHNVNIMIIKNK